MHIVCSVLLEIVTVCFDAEHFFIARHSSKWFRLLVSMLPLRGLSVCLSVTFVHRARTAEDIDEISFVYDIMSRSMSPFATLLWPLLAQFALDRNLSLTDCMADCWVNKQIGRQQRIIIRATSSVPAHGAAAALAQYG